MIAPGQFRITPDSVTCAICDAIMKREPDTTDEKWGDGTQNFIEMHKESCKENDDNQS